MHRFSDKMQGILWMIIHCFAVAIITISTTQAAKGVGIYMVSAMVYSMAFPMTFFARQLHKSTRGKKILPTKRWKMYFVRASMGLLSYITFAYGLTQMSMSDVSAIVFTTPLFGVILAILYFKEKATWQRMLSLFVGFLGAMVIISPDGNFNEAAIIVLFSSFSYALVHLSIKSLVATDKHGEIIFYTQLLMFLASLPMLCIFWEIPDIKSVLWCLLTATCWHLSILGLSKSYQKAEAIVVMPFQFMRLVFVVILSAMFFNQPTSLTTIIGAAIILSAAILSAKHENKAVKK